MVGVAFFLILFIMCVSEVGSSENLTKGEKYHVIRPERERPGPC